MTPELARYLEEATSMGAAICGGVGIGAYPDFTVAEQLNRPVDFLSPDPSKAGMYETAYGFFRRAYDRLKPLYQDMAHTS